MAFYIYLVLVALSFVLVLTLNMKVWGNWFWESFGFAAIWTLLVAFVLGILFGMLTSAGRNVGAEYKFIGEQTVTLKSLGNTTGIQGRSYFLGGGYVGTDRVLNYATVDAEGYVRLTSAPAWASAVKEDAASAAEARVKVLDVEKRQDWLWPWPSSIYKNYEFHVPAGSVAGDFTVDNK